MGSTLKSASINRKLKPTRLKVFLRDHIVVKLPTFLPQLHIHPSLKHLLSCVR
jgi:hypothetical protein